MSVDKTIALELGTLSPVVAGIGRATIYGVPEGYFEGFAGEVMSRIAGQGEGLAESPLLTEAHTGILAGISGLPAYKVPEGYFESFAAKLLQRIKAEEARSADEELEILSPLLSGLRGKEPFTTPAGYFSDLPGNLVAELQALRFVNDELGKTQATEEYAGTGNAEAVNGEADTLSPLLSGLKNKETYTVSPGYFDTLASDIWVSVSRSEQEGREAEKGAKVISLQPKKTLGKGWMKYAVAAAVTGLLLTAGIRVLNHTGGGITVKHTENAADSSNLAKVSDQEILNYLENQNEPLADVAANYAQDINDGDVKDFLGDVPDAELQQYVDEHGSTKDPVTN